MPDVFDTITDTTDIFDKVAPTVKPRGVIPEFGAAVTRGALNVGAGLVGTVEATSPLLNVLAVTGVTKPKEELREATKRIQLAGEKFPRTRPGVVGWAENVIGETIPYMGTALAGGYLAGPVGAMGVGFAVEGQNAYERAKSAGATESQAQTERLIVGSINASIEALQISRIMKFHKAGRGSFQTFLNSAINKARGETVRQGLKFGAEILKVAVEEAAEEALQEGVSIIVPGIARKDLPRKPDGTVDIKAIFEQIGGAALGGGVSGAFFAGLGVVGGRVREQVSGRPLPEVPIEPSRISPEKPETIIAQQPSYDPFYEEIQKAESRIDPTILPKVQKYADENQLSPEDYLQELNEMIKEFPVEGIKKTPTLKRKQLLGYIHKIPLQILGWTEEQYRGKLKELTGKKSAKNLSMKELRLVYNNFRNLYGGDITLIPEDYERPITFADKTTTMSNVMADVIQNVDATPSIVTIPEHIRKQVFGVGIKEAAVRTREFFVGIDTSRPARLSKMLGGFKDSILTQIFRDDLVEKGANKKAAILQNIHEEWNRFREGNNLDSEILAKFSTTQARHILPIEMIKELMGVGPDIVEVTFNKRKYPMTWGQITNAYLQIRQKEGQAHVEKNGANIANIYTGPFSEEDVTTFKTLAESNPLVVKIANWLENTIDPLYWKPEVNSVSREIVGTDIATKEQYWPLDVIKTRRLAKGKQFAFKPSKLIYNAIEDRSFFQPRKGPTGVLDFNHDFFEKFSAVNNAMAEYAAYATPLKIARTVLSDSNIINNWRIKGYEKIHNHLNRILTNEIDLPATQGTLEHILSVITRNAAKAVIWLNARTLGVQASSIPLILNHTSAKYVTEGIKYANATNLEDAAKITPWIWARYYMDIGPRQVGGIAEGSPNLVLQYQGKLPWSQITGIGLKKSDAYVFKVAQGVAIAEYEDAQTGKLEPESNEAEYWKNTNIFYKKGTEGWRQQINDRFTILKRGQQSWDKFDRSIQTSSKEMLSKIAFLFRSFHEGALNTAQEAIDDWQHTGKDPSKKLGTVAATYASEAVIRWSIGNALIALIGSGMMALGIKKEPKWLSWTDLLVDMTTGSLDLIPIVGRRIQNQINNFVRILVGEKIQYAGKVTETLPLQVINTLVAAPENFTNAIAFYLKGENKKGDVAFKRALGQLYEGLGLATGEIPVYEIGRVRKIIEGEGKSISHTRKY